MHAAGAAPVMALRWQAPGTRLGVGRRSLRTTTARRSLSVAVRAEGCPFCADVGKCISICRNPQNTGLPEAVPSPEQSAPTAVCVQLDALANNNTPRPNHGLQVAYYFCGDAAPMERSRYFGPSKDIWQFDHFMSAWVQYYRDMLELRSYDIVSCKDLPDGRARVDVVITGRQSEEPKEFVFLMRRGEQGTKYAGSWLTHRLLHADSQWVATL